MQTEWLMRPLRPEAASAAWMRVVSEAAAAAAVESRAERRVSFMAGKCAQSRRRDRGARKVKLTPKPGPLRRERPRGRKAGIRPADLVGAITGESGVTSRSIGAIEIADKFSLVEVPESVADKIITALRATMIRGKKILVKRQSSDLSEAR